MHLLFYVVSRVIHTYICKNLRFNPDKFGDFKICDRKIGTKNDGRQAEKIVTDVFNIRTKITDTFFIIIILPIMINHIVTN